MKKVPSDSKAEELRPEYGRELLAAMKPNRFAGVDLKLKSKRVAEVETRFTHEASPVLSNARP